VTATCDTFYVDPRRVRGARWSALAFALLALWFARGIATELAGRGLGVPWWLWALTAAVLAFLSFHRAWALAHRARPVIRIDDERLEWGSTYHFTNRRRRVALAEIRGIGWKTPREIRIDTRAGPPVALRLAEIDPVQRQAVYDALERRLPARQRD